MTSRLPGPPAPAVLKRPERHRIVDVTGSEGGRPVPGQAGGIVVTPEAASRPAWRGDDDLEVAPGTEAALNRKTAAWLSLGLLLADMEEEWVD